MNKDDSELIFTQIENEISQFCNKGEVLICGDFNARTGGLPDFIQNDDLSFYV
jgi:endonuclease/exonuclease/phosphatase (EEP) superfamily protein YafD